MGSQKAGMQLRLDTNGIEYEEQMTKCELLELVHCQQNYGYLLSPLDLSYYAGVANSWQVHDIEFAPNLEYVFKQTLPVLQEAVKEGKVRYLGVTGYPVSILQRAVESSPIKLNVVLSYCRNTLIDDSLSEILPLLQFAIQQVIVQTDDLTRIVGSTDKVRFLMCVSTVGSVLGR
uniref:NADP-dependent oxidoreductase domain-containing protein n=1 Tax=Timema monikensis TaxID=170555 RepID=A0A7R9HT06_9NEOP|nr:unnamed protein product [Timema monikensis]